MKHVGIHIGEMYASREPAVIETVLGSCVAVCLFDPVARIGGMNHILLPLRQQQDPALARYGEHAIPMLIERVLNLGGTLDHLQAKVFGAAHVLLLDTTRINVPHANEHFVREFLKHKTIPVIAERLGGRHALKVRMYTATGKALVRALPRTSQENQVAREDQQHLSALQRRWGWFDAGVAIEGAP